MLIQIIISRCINSAMWWPESGDSKVEISQPFVCMWAAEQLVARSVSLAQNKKGAQTWLEKGRRLSMTMARWVRDSVWSILLGDMLMVKLSALPAASSTTVPSRPVLHVFVLIQPSIRCWPPCDSWTVHATRGVPLHWHSGKRVSRRLRK